MIVNNLLLALLTSAKQHFILWCCSERCKGLSNELIVHVAMNAMCILVVTPVQAVATLLAKVLVYYVATRGFTPLACKSSQQITMH